MTARAMASQDDAKDLFGLFDKKGKGTIRTTNLGSLMRSLGRHPSNKNLFEWEEKIGKDMSFDAFWEAMQAPESAAAESIEAALKVGEGWVMGG